MIIAVDPGANGAFVWSVDGHGVQARKMPGTDVEICELMAELSCKTKSVAKAKLMLAEAARAAEQHCPGCVIKFGINAGRAWFNVL